MNDLASRHLTRATQLFAKGDGYYREAAREIIAAKDADFTLSNQEIGEMFGKSKDWVGRIVRWATSDSAPSSPFIEPGRETTDIRGARRVLAEAPLEQVEQIISELPRERQQALGAAAGHGYLKARQEYAESERNLTPSQRKEREAVGDSLTESARKARGGFATLGIAGHIDQATEELRELVADSSLTPDSWKIIAAALSALVEEAQVAAAMVGLELDLQEV